MKYLHVLALLLCMGVAGQSQDIIEYSFRVEGVCGMCQQRIERVAMDKGKAKSADWDLASKILIVTIDESVTDVSAVKWFLSQAGHDNGDYIAPDSVYDNIHSCCKYRDPDIVASHTEQGQDQSEKETDDDHRHVHEIEGYIYAMEDGEKIALIGANIIFEGASEGTTTNLEGYFRLDNSGHHDTIRVSYIGYDDQLITLEQDYIEITLADGHTLDVVEIVYRKRTTEISFVNSLNSENITREELCKAACCNLSESFETNPSVDVSFNDAITGTKQIQMLGLAGPYVQITRELIPDVRVMNTIYGLNTTPGPWIESIQLIKGTGSVVNGFESITGQINVELKKPERDELLHINGFMNSGGRLELNTNARHEFNKFVSTAVLFHGKTSQQVHDTNDDGFTDMPLEDDLVLVNRWKFKRKKNFEGQLGVKLSRLNHKGGSHDHFAETSENHEEHWSMASATRRYEAWGKLGYIFPYRPEMSIGLQVSTLVHDQDANYGLTKYDADQKSGYANLIFQNIFDNGHIIRTGLSYQIDDVKETVSYSGIYERLEVVPGAFAEYAFKMDDKLSIIPGIRIDHHNNYGTFLTPRLHAKYNLGDRSIVRFTGGRGLRTASIFAENMGLFASSRSVFIVGNDPNTPYGLQPEVAWNYGFNYTQGLTIGDKEFIVSLDAYRTSFENQIVANFETAGSVTFSNLNGSSYSNSYQVKLEYELFKNFDARVAYRLFDVQTTYEQVLQKRPFVSKHRAFINVAYKTKNDWFFDTTLNWRGSQRLPNTNANPKQYQRRANSPDFFLLSAQISKRWGKKLDVYLGGENLLNYQQTDAIIAGDEPFGKYFDGSIVWAPLFGRNIYLGFRYNLIGKKK